MRPLINRIQKRDDNIVKDNKFLRTINKEKKLLVFILFMTIPIIYTTTALAYEEGTVTAFLMEFSDLLSENTFFKDVFRWIGWGIIKFLHWVAEGCQTLYKYSLGMVDFTSYVTEENLGIDLKTLFEGLLILTLTIYGIILIVNPKKKANIIHSALIAAICVCALGSIMGEVNKGIKSFGEEMADSSLANDVINTHLYDWVYIDRIVGLENVKKSEDDKLHYKNVQVSSFLDYIEINEVINYEGDLLTTDFAKEVFGAQLTGIYLGTEFEEFFAGALVDGWLFGTDEVYNGFGWNSGDDNDWFNEFYYRYSFNAFPIIVSLISVIIVYLCISYKTVRLLYELPFKKVIALLYSADVNGSQKTWKILGNIKDTYIILFLSALSLKFYSLGVKFCVTNFSDNTIVQCIILIFIAFAVVDAPNIVQALTGEDAGLNSAFSKIYGLSRLGKSAAGAGLFPIRVAANEFKYQRQASRISKAMNKRKAKPETSNTSADTGKQFNNDIRDAMNSNSSGSNANVLNTGNAGANANDSMRDAMAGKKSKVLGSNNSDISTENSRRSSTVDNNSSTNNAPTDNTSGKTKDNLNGNMSSGAEKNPSDNISNGAKNNLKDDISRKAENNLKDSMSNGAESNLKDDVPGGVDNSLNGDISSGAENNLNSNISGAAESNLNKDISSGISSNQIESMESTSSIATDSLSDSVSGLTGNTSTGNRAEATKNTLSDDAAGIDKKVSDSAVNRGTKGNSKVKGNNLAENNVSSSGGSSVKKTGNKERKLPLNNSDALSNSGVSSKSTGGIKNNSSNITDSSNLKQGAINSSNDIGSEKRAMDKANSLKMQDISTGKVKSNTGNEDMKRDLAGKSNVSIDTANNDKIDKKIKSSKSSGKKAAKNIDNTLKNDKSVSDLPKKSSKTVKESKLSSKLNSEENLKS